MIDEIVNKPNSPAVTFTCKWDIKYPQVIEEVVRHVEAYYSRAKNLSTELKAYLTQNNVSAIGIKLYRVQRQKSSTIFHMAGKYESPRKNTNRHGKKEEVVCKLILKRRTESASLKTAYHLTFEIRNLSADGFSANSQLSIKEAEAFSEYAKSLGIPMRQTAKPFY